ncbi:MAG: hypothetical protein V4813_06650 [Gemmatimonadota bacterium]
MALALPCLLASSPLAAQPVAAAPLLDALSITVQQDSATVARGSLRLRQVRTGADLELVATGTLVRKGLRITAELRTDSLFGLRRYTAESRDSAGALLDRVQVTSAGGRVTLERVTPRRRQVREYFAQRDLMILDSASVVPFVMLAGIAQRAGGVLFLDVRSGLLTQAQTAPGTAADLTMAEALVSGTPIAVTGLATPLTWWRDSRGHLLRVVWGTRARVLRDDPPA